MVGGRHNVLGAHHPLQTITKERLCPEDLTPQRGTAQAEANRTKRGKGQGKVTRVTFKKLACLLSCFSQRFPIATSSKHLLP